MTTQEDPRPGERVQTWWRKECGTEHTTTVLGGLVIPPLEAPKLEHQPLENLREIQSRRDEQEEAA